MDTKPTAQDLVVSTLRVGKWKFDLAVPVDQIPRDSIDTLSAVTLRLDKPILVSGKTFPIVVFPVRLKKDLKFEQTAEGFPCLSESEAQTVAQAIQDKNRKTPLVVLASWSGHFGLATLTNEEYFREELVLFTYHEPQIIEGQHCGYELRIYKYFLDKPREIIWREILHTADPEVAAELLKKKHLELLKQESERKNNLKNSTAQSGAELADAQLNVLAKAYPKTVSYLRNPAPKNIEAAFAAYTEEAVAASKNLNLIGSLNKSEFKEVARLLRNAARRKNPPINDVEFELVVGWRLRGYDKKTPEQRFQSLKKLGFEPASPGAIRKMCERLQLPTIRKRGAPKKSPPNK